MKTPRPGWSGLFLVALLGFALAPAPSRADESLGVLDEMDELDDSFERLAAERDMAEGRYEASQANVSDLNRKRIEVLRQTQSARIQEYRAGHGTLDLLLEGQYLLVSARQPPERKANVNRDALEVLWRAAWEAEKLAHFRHEAGQIRTVDYLSICAARLDAELQLALSRPKKK